MPDKERNLGMLILAYLWILALVPLLVEQEDDDLQWHAKHGLVLFGVELILVIIVIFFTSTLTFILPGILSNIMWIISCLFWVILWLGLVALHITCIMKASRGERFLIPTLSQLADRF